MPRGFVANYDESMVVVHREPELRISRKLVWFGGKEEKSEDISYTDGRGETNPATVWLSTNPQTKPAHLPETTSKTKWSAEKIVTRYMIRLFAGSHVVEQEVVDGVHPRPGVFTARAPCQTVRR